MRRDREFEREAVGRSSYGDCHRCGGEIRQCAPTLKWADTPSALRASVIAAMPHESSRGMRGRPELVSRAAAAWVQVSRAVLTPVKVTAPLVATYLTLTKQAPPSNVRVPEMAPLAGSTTGVADNRHELMPAWS